MGWALLNATDPTTVLARGASPLLATAGDPWMVGVKLTLSCHHVMLHVPPPIAAKNSPNQAHSSTRILCFRRCSS